VRRPAPAKPRRAREKSWPAPTRGWIANNNLAEPEHNGAFVLDNFFPETETVRMFGGKLKYATIGDGEDDVVSLFSYKTGGNEKFFAATATAIYEISSVADPGVSPAAIVSAQTSGDWAGAQIQTAGGTFLRLVNAADRSQLYDGTTFLDDPIYDIYDSADPGHTDISDTFTNAWVYKKRLFFIQGNLNAYYLPVESIAGAAVKLPLGGVFKLGGSLLFGTTWSQDVGDGLQAFCVFVTTEGECAVFAGSDPGSVNDWFHVGTYRIGRPMGKNAWFQAGGDVAIATDIGLIALSAARTRDVAALAPASASWPIHSAWNERVNNRGFASWHCALWPTRQMVLVGVPSNEDFAPEMPIANAVTGAWCRRTNWDAKCIEIFKERAFIGSGGGKVFLLETTGADDGVPYTATCLLHADALRDPASDKYALLCRAILRARERPNDIVFVNANFDDVLPTAPDAPFVESGSIWGEAIWGEDLWALDTDERTRFGEWRSVSAMGDVLAPGIRVTSGNLQPPRTDLIRFDMTYDKTDIVA
jgi:hypothetical protein